MPTHNTPVKHTRSTALLGQLREAVLSGELPAGQKLNMLHLRSHFQVSLSPLREALARLLAEGLVTFADHRGYRVTPLSEDSLCEIVLLRTHLETLALRHALQRGDLAWESEVLRTLHRLSHTTPDTEDAGSGAQTAHWETAHAAFHQALLAGCALPALLAQVAALHTQQGRYWRQSSAPLPEAPFAPEPHRTLAEAALARNAEAACTLLQAHIHEGAAALCQRFNYATANLLTGPLDNA